MQKAPREKHGVFRKIVRRPYPELMLGALLASLMSIGAATTALAAAQPPVTMLAELRGIAPLKSPYFASLSDPRSIDYALSFTKGIAPEAAMPAGELRKPWENARILRVQECVKLPRLRGYVDNLVCIPISGPYQGRAPF